MIRKRLFSWSIVLLLAFHSVSAFCVCPHEESSVSDQAIASTHHHADDADADHHDHHAVASATPDHHDHGGPADHHSRSGGDCCCVKEERGTAPQKQFTVEPHFAFERLIPIVVVSSLPLEDPLSSLLELRNKTVHAPPRGRPIYLTVETLLI